MKYLFILLPLLALAAGVTLLGDTTASAAPPMALSTQEFEAYTCANWWPAPAYCFPPTQPVPTLPPYPPVVYSCYPAYPGDWTECQEMTIFDGEAQAEIVDGAPDATPTPRTMRIERPRRGAHNSSP